MMPMMAIMLIVVVAGFYYLYQGIDMHAQVDALETVFHQNQADYFSVAKSERDAAATGSALNSQLVEIMNTPSQLLQLKLVGVGKILTGIFALLFGILIALASMPVRLAAIIKRK